MKKIIVLTAVMSLVVSGLFADLSKTIPKGALYYEKVGSAVHHTTNGFYLKDNGGANGSACALQFYIPAALDNLGEISVSAEIFVDGVVTSGSIRYQWMGGANYIKTLSSIYNTSKRVFNFGFTSNTSQIFRVWADGISPTTQKVYIRSITFVVNGVSYCTVF